MARNDRGDLVMDCMDEKVYMNVSVESITDYWDPMYDDIWACGRISIQDVKNCKELELGSKAFSENDENLKSWRYNVARIAWFVKNGWSNCRKDTQPILIEVSCIDDFHPIYVVDGNHRLAAAIVRGEEFILAEISGDLLKAEEILKVKEFKDNRNEELKIGATYE